jgi:multidrug efflux pump subunit AcrB
VARKIENAIATLQGLKHIYTKVQDGGSPSPPSSGWKNPCRRRWTMCARPWQRVRADLPGDVRDPMVTKMDLAAQPVLAFTVRLAAAWTTRR